MMTNNILKESRYNSSIDNVACQADPMNVMICPIIDFKQGGVIAGDAGATTEEGPKVLGVVQFVNKVDRGHITEDDIVSQNHPVLITL